MNPIRALLLSLALFSKTLATEKPTIIIIFTDDQGYGDLSCYDNPGDIKTPNIDRIAKQGVKLTDGYSTCAHCGPSRAGLMSGRYQHRFGYVRNRDVFNDGCVQQTTLPQVLKKSGYTTGIIGKWHLGRIGQDRWPNNRGFDEFYGFLYSMRAFFEVKGTNNPIFRNKTPIPEPKEYLTDIFNREAVDFVDRHAGKQNPFFLYLSYNAPHYPLEAKEEDIKLFNTGDEKRDIYLAMMKTVDEGVGRVLDKLKAKGVMENTLIFFLSDNGGDINKGGTNGPLRGSKSTVFEGGHRVPFLVSWPKQLKAGSISKVPVMSFDIFATSVAAAGGKMPDDGKEYDSQDMLPYLKGEKTGYIRPTLVWTSPAGGSSFAIRHHDWKLLLPKGKKMEPMLFDLAKDPGETSDLAATHPEKVKQLSELYTQWRAKMQKEEDQLLGANHRDEKR